MVLSCTHLLELPNSNAAPIIHFVKKISMADRDAKNWCSHQHTTTTGSLELGVALAGAMTLTVKQSSPSGGLSLNNKFWA